MWLYFWCGGAGVGPFLFPQLPGCAFGDHEPRTPAHILSFVILVYFSKLVAVIILNGRELEACVFVLALHV